MKKIQRNPGKFDVIELFSKMGSIENFKLNDPDSKKDFLSIIRKSLDTNLTDTVLYGLRTEELFGVILSSLDKCILIKKEDSGDIVAKDEVAVPDYRVIHKDGSSYFIEVKNYYQKDPYSSYTMNGNYYDKLEKYSRIMNTPILLAIYWAKWNVWTLTNFEVFNLIDGKHELTFEEAMMSNQMILFGDVTLGVKSPISMRLYPDNKKLNRIKNNIASFTIDKVEFWNGERQIENKREINIAFHIMMFGKWKVEDIIHINDLKVEYIEYLSQPMDDENFIKQGFDMIGNMSGMISSHYNWITAPDGIITKISLEERVSNLGFKIPDNYKSKELPLWIFRVAPKYK